VLATRDMGQRIPHPVDAAPLPCGLEHADDGCLEAGRVRGGFLSKW
jgi:hypothetical protein